MLFATPKLTKDVSARLEPLDGLRKKLGEEAATFSPWMGTLRREVKALSVESSTSIEGFEVTHDEALALVDGKEVAPEDEHRMAVACYARAMDHVGVMASDPAFRWSDRVILDLHFDACYFQKDKSPGHWRRVPVSVTASAGGTGYTGPDWSEVPKLMAEVVAWLEKGDMGAHPVVRAAIAHLHVASVHPFHDGNGRISRITQSLVLAREQLVSPEFGSIEEYLAKNTADYYAALQEVQGGAYQPDRDASAWVEFCVHAHTSQAEQRLAQIDQAASRWSALEAISCRGDVGYLK